MNRFEAFTFGELKIMSQALAAHHITRGEEVEFENLQNEIALEMQRRSELRNRPET